MFKPPFFSLRTQPPPLPALAHLWQAAASSLPAFLGAWSYGISQAEEGTQQATILP